jgi:hypothetical protein
MISLLKKHRVSLLALGFYLLVFTIYFLSFPLNSALISNQDSIYYIAVFNYLQNLFSGIITGQDLEHFFYPDPLPFLNGEPALGIFLMWSILKIFITNNIYTLYALIVAIFSLNSFSVFYLIRQLNKGSSVIVAIISGLVFSFNMFILANIDNVNTIFFAPGILCITIFNSIVFEQKTQKKIVLLFSLLFLFQLTCSIYNFIYVVIFLSLFVLIYFKKNIAFLKIVRIKYLILYLPLLGLSACYLYFVIFYPGKQNHWSFNIDLDSIKTFSFELKNFISVIPNTLYGSERESALFDMKSLFGGYIFYLVVLIGIKSFWKTSKGLLLIPLVCLIIGIGPYVSINETQILMPLGYLFNAIENYSYFRIPYRIYLLILLVLILVFSYGLQLIEKKLSKNKVLIVIIALLIILENIPFKREYTDFTIYQNEGVYLAKLLNQPSINNVLFLPAGDLINRNGDPTVMNRTVYIFMYWQTCIGKNVINGSSAFNPPHTLELNEAFYNSITPHQALVQYCKKYKIDCVVHYTEPHWAFDEFNFNQQKIKIILEQNGIAYFLR